MIVHDFFDHGLGALKVNIRTFNEDPSHVVFFHGLESNLNLGSALSLQMTDGFTILSDDKTDNVVWNGYNVGLG